MGNFSRENEKGYSIVIAAAADSSGLSLRL